MSGFSGDQKCNAAGRAIVESFEKFCPIPYYDPNGIPTQGYGHTRGVTMGSPSCTLETADQWLEDDLGEAEHALNELVRYELSSNRFSALVAFVFNIGFGNFERSSALQLLNSGDFDKVPAHMRLWNKDHHGNVLNGLVRRRDAEVALFDTPDPEGDPDELTV